MIFLLVFACLVVSIALDALWVRGTEKGLSLFLQIWGTLILGVMLLKITLETFDKYAPSTVAITAACCAVFILIVKYIVTRFMGGKE